MERAIRHLVAAVAPGAAAALLLAGSAGAAGESCPKPPATAAAKKQRAAMLCHVNALRHELGVRELRRSRALDRAARMKAADIVRCRSFSHTPCGRSFASTFAAAGYTRGSWTVGENLAWGSGRRGAVASAFASLVRSPRHYGNFVRRGWRDIGIALWRGSLFGRGNVSLWVIDFGAH